MIIGVLIIIVALLIDQITKSLIVYHFEPYVAVINGTERLVSNVPGFDVIPGILDVDFFGNTGASLGSFDGARLFFFVITVLALIFFGYMFTKVNFKKAKIYSLSISLFIAGTLGNAIDRAIRPIGAVIDFMHFPFIDWIVVFHNNWADMWLSAAIVLFAIDVIFLEHKRSKKEKESVNESV